MMKALRSFTVRGTDGNDLTISETHEEDQVVVSIQQNDDEGRIATVRLGRAEFEAFFDTRYELKLKDKASLL